MPSAAILRAAAKCSGEVKLPKCCSGLIEDMKPIDILSCDSRKLAFLFKLGKSVVRSVGLCVAAHKQSPVVLEEYVRMPVEERAGKQRFRRITEIADGFEYAVLTAKIGYAAFGGYSCAAKKNYAAAVLDHLL